MSQKSNVFNFTMGYNELLNLSYEKQTLLTRDQPVLDARGITTSRLADFAALQNAFMAVPTDSTMKADISNAVVNRDAVANNLRIAIREVLGIARNKYGEGSATYKAFNPTDISSLDAAALCFLSVTIVAEGTEHLKDLSDFGLTQAMLDDITNMKTDLEAKIRLVTTAESGQLGNTEQRHDAANNLYDEMKAMCSIAQVYFADRDPLKASEYVIYDTAGSSQQRNGILAAGAVVGRSLDAVAASTAFRLQVKAGNELEFYFSQTEGGDAGAKTITVGVDPNNYTDATAEQMGYNSSTGFIKFCIKNAGSVETVYRVVAN